MKMITTLMIAATLGLGACNTVGGVAKDTWGGTKYIYGKATSGDRAE